MSAQVRFTTTNAGVWTVEGVAPGLLTELLLQFELLARKAGAPVDRLAPGVDEANVRAEFAAHGRPCPDELVEWFGWRNGFVQGGPSNYATPQTMMLPVSIAASAESIEGTSWIRLTADTNGLAIDLSTPPGEILRTGFIEEGGDFYPGWSADNETGGRADSLCTFVAWWIFGIENGGWVWDGREWAGWIPSLAPSQRAAGFV